MPDLRFLSEAAFFIGCGVGGLPLLTLGYLLGMRHPRFPIVTYGQNWYQEARWKSSNRVRSVEVSASDTTNMGRQRAGEAYLTGSVAAGVTSSRRGTKQLAPRQKPGTAVHLNRRQKINLCALILNETRRNANDLPREDVPLTHDMLERYGFGSKVRRRVRDEIVEKKLGWKDDAGIVYLDRHKAREFVARARRAGVIGGG